MNNRQNVHLKILEKFASMQGYTSKKFRNTFIDQNPDEYVKEKHHLLSNIRGVYVPKNYDFAYSIKVSIDSKNYGNKIENMDDRLLITYYLPDKIKDGQKNRDIKALKNNFKNNIPLGIVLKENNKYVVLGLGSIIEFNTDYIIVECNNTINASVEFEKPPMTINVEKLYSVKLRLKQHEFRNKVLGLYSSCNLCGCNIQDILIASHIKPWSHSDDNEKLDMYNGLLLCPNHDKLFDLGYITFDQSGKIKISSLISGENSKLLNLDKNYKLEISPSTCRYLKYHEENIFVQ